MMNIYLPLTIFCCFLGVFQAGFSVSSVNVPEAYIESFLINSFKERYGINLTLESVATVFSIAVSIIGLGAVVGALSVGWVSEKFGRKWGFLYPQALSILAAILMGCCKSASSYEMLLLGRLLIGTSVGLLTGISLLYSAEIAPIHIRGALIIITQLGSSAGNLASYVLGLSNLLGGNDTWPLLLAFVAVPSLLICVILPFMPDSPRYLILSKDQHQEAEEALKKLRNTDDVKHELKGIMEEEQNFKGETKYTIRKFLMSKKLRLPFVICIALCLCNIFSGYIALESYSTSIYESAGISAEYSQYGTIGLGTINLIMTTITACLLEGLGRRTVLLTGLSGIVISSMMITIALVYSTLQYDGVFLVTSTVLFMVFYSTLKVGVVAVTELFTQGPRSAAISLSLFFIILGQMLVALIYPQMEVLILEYSFLPFLVIEAVLLVFLFIYLPETKNMTTGDIALLFHPPNAWKTAIGFKKQTVSDCLNSKGCTNYGSTVTSDIE